jgi:tRNA 2-thiouridine synthesizing protein A
VSHYELDVRRMLCPLPVIRSQDRVEQLQPGDTLAVSCTDPGAKHDIPAWCRVNGHEMVSIEEQQDEIIITIRVGDTD